MDGARLGDRYQLLRRIGAGGMAEVWEATDHSLGRQVAVKLLHKHLAQDPSILARFRSEAQSAARLTHPGIVSIFDTVTTGDTDAIVMELVEGRDLRSILDQRRSIAIDDCLEVAIQVAQALGHAHQNGIIHRDIKPANILVRPDRRVKLSDFGIAKALDDTTFTETGSLVGTVKYLAPEQIQGAPIDGRTDLYSLSTVLYEMLCGTVPFPAQDLAGAMSRVRTPAPRASTHRRDLPPELDEFLARALAIDPQDRPLDASQWVASLQAVRRGDATTISRAADVPAAPIVSPPRPEAARPKSIPMRAPEPEPAAPTKTRKRSRLEVLWPIVAAVLMIAALATVWMLLRPASENIGNQLTTDAPETTANIETSDADVETTAPEATVATGEESTDTTEAVDTEAAPTEEGAETTDDAVETDAAEETTTTTTTTTIPDFVDGVRAISFDPFGDDGVEHPEAVGRALDGNPDTFWYTQGYASRDFGRIKSGVGYVLEFDGGRSVSTIDIQTNATGWAVTIYEADEIQTVFENWGEPIATFGDLDSTASLEVPQMTASAVLLWFTDLGEPIEADEDSELIRLEVFELALN